MLLLNFIPKHIITKFKHEVFTKIAYALSLFGIIWISVFGIVTFSAYQYLAIQKESIENRLQATQSLRDTEEAQLLENKINAINQSALRINTIKEAQPYEFYDLLIHLAQLVPDGINLTSLVFVANSNQITIEGNSSLRTYVIILQERLENSPFFGEIEAPLTNLLQAENVNFKFTISTIREG